MNLDSIVPVARRAALAVLALAATVVGVRAAAHGSHRRVGSSETYNDDGSFTLTRDLGDGRRMSVHVSGPVRFEDNGTLGTIGPGGVVAIDTGDSRNEQRMLITSEDGKPRYQWWVNGKVHAVDADAQAWLADALEVVAASQAIGRIQGHVGSLQGQIGSIQGEIGSLQGRIGSIQGAIGALQGKIGAIQGEEGSVEGRIGSHEGAIGGLEAARTQASPALRDQLDREIAQHRAEIEKARAELTSGAVAKRLQDAQAELRAAEERAHGEIAAIEREIDGVHGRERIAKIEQDIRDLHADDRIHEIERKSDPALERLKGRIGTIGG